MRWSLRSGATFGDGPSRPSARARAGDAPHGKGALGENLQEDRLPTLRYGLLIAAELEKRQVAHVPGGVIRHGERSDVDSGQRFTAQQPCRAALAAGNLNDDFEVEVPQQMTRPRTPGTRVIGRRSAIREIGDAQCDWPPGHSCCSCRRSARSGQVVTPWRHIRPPWITNQRCLATEAGHITVDYRRVGHGDLG